MTPEQLKYIRDWAQNGNDAKFACDIEDLLPEELGAWRMLDKHEDSLCELTPAALAAALDALEQANETAEGIAPVDEWLPIESAPKDGKPVLLLISDGVSTVGEWCGASETWDSQYVTTGEYRDPDEYGPIEDGEVWVTHYRPLPQPPKEMR